MGIIHAFLLAHVIFDGDSVIHKATSMIPETSATVPKTACAQTFIDSTKESSLIAGKLVLKDGIMIIKIEKVCSTSASPVK